MRFFESLFLFVCTFVVLSCSINATEFHVAQRAKNASDKNPGTENKPWRTLKRIETQKLQAGDKVVIHSGVYRENLSLENLKGNSEKPIVIEGAKGEGPVIIKGATAFKGKWEPYGKTENRTEPYPNAYMRRWVADYDQGPVSQVVLSDFTHLRQIGQDPIQTAPSRLPPVGFDSSDMFRHTFFQDQKKKKLYVDVFGAPSWYTIDVNNGKTLIHLKKCSHVVVRDLELRYGRFGLGAIYCDNLLIENLDIDGASNNGIGLRLCEDCRVVNCATRRCGCTGMGLAACRRCEVVNCELTHNNFRDFHPGWHAGGTKNVKCVDCAFIGCEVAYNRGDGIWFDIDNQNIRIIGNRIHHNEGGAIHYEISVGETLIANNLIYRNKFGGVYISCSSGCRIINNTIVENGAGVVIAGEGRKYGGPPKPPLLDVTEGGKLLKPWGVTEKHYALMQNRVYNNLLICNGLRRGDGKSAQILMVNQSKKDAPVGDNLSDYNAIASAGWWKLYFGRRYNDHLGFEQWREKTGQDKHSKLIPVPSYRIGGNGLFEWLKPNDLAKELDFCPLRAGVEKDIDNKDREDPTDAGACQLNRSFWSFLY